MAKRPRGRPKKYDDPITISLWIERGTVMDIDVLRRKTGESRADIVMTAILLMTVAPKSGW